jgi:hypothetical protein
MTMLCVTIGTSTDPLTLDFYVTTTPITIATYFDGFGSPNMIVTIPTSHKGVGNLVEDGIPYK